MRLLFLSDNFPPEVNAPASRTYEHCLEWVKQGVEVTVITCFPNFPKGEVFSGYKNKTYTGEIDGVSSRINADTRSLLTRVKINNENFELIPGSLLEVIVKFNQRVSLAVPDTGIMLEGNKAYVYKISKNNIAIKTEIKVGTRNNGFVEIISGLSKENIIAAEGLKKVRPNGKIKPINK